MPEKHEVDAHTAISNSTTMWTYHFLTSIPLAKQRVTQQYSMVSIAFEYGSVQSEHEKLMHTSDIPLQMVINHHPSRKQWQSGLRTLRGKVHRGGGRTAKELATCILGMLL